MSPPDPRPPARDRKPSNRGAEAGMLLLAALLACGGIGFGLGALIGAPVVLGIVGLFAGGVAGFFAVYTRFKDL
jgi:hypothetical protein